MNREIKGLNNFIASIRQARVGETEEKVVNEELAKIRSKSKRIESLNGYQIKKYVAKLIFVYIIGYPVRFGHAEAIRLMTSKKYSEKQIGYLACTLWLDELSEMMSVAKKCIERDLCVDAEVNNAMALQAVASIGGKDFAQSFAKDVNVLMVSPISRNDIRKRAVLAMLRLYRADRSCVQNLWAERMISLIDSDDLGVALAASSLLYALAKDAPGSYITLYEKAVFRLKTIVIDKDYQREYLYNGYPCPWLLINLLRIIQLFPVTDIANVRSALLHVLETIINNQDPETANYQHRNISNAVIFEAFYTIIHLGKDTNLFEMCAYILINFVTGPDVNSKYLALETLSYLASSGEISDGIRMHLETLLNLLDDSDLSLRRKVVDLLYILCDESNAKRIIRHFLKSLDSHDCNFKDQIVSKVAVLIENYSNSSEWKIDVLVSLLFNAGDYVSDDVWHKICQIVSCDKGVQAHASKLLVGLLRRQNVHKYVIKTAGYILGEFGHLIAGIDEFSAEEQFYYLEKRYEDCDERTKALLLTTFLKFSNAFPELIRAVREIFLRELSSEVAEIKQRASEYYNMMDHPAMCRFICSEMPPLRPKTISSNSLAISQSSDDDVLSISTTTSFSSMRNQLLKRPNLSTQNSFSSSSVKFSDLKEMRKEIEALSAGWETGFYRLIRRPNGILYESSTVRITLTSQYTGYLGSLVLNCKNATGADFSSLTFEIVDSPVGLECKSKAFASPKLASGKVCHYPLEIIALKNFTSSPIIRISYLVGSLQQVILKLPVTLHKFMAPAVDITPNIFLSRWQQLESKESYINDQNVVLSIPGNIIDLQKTREILRICNWGISEDFSDEPTIVRAASILTLKSGNVGCLLELRYLTDKSVSSLSTVIFNTL